MVSMASASGPSSYIYEGVWINWVKGGRVFGATLTVDPAHAVVLSPALALIISIAGSQLWRLFQFALHQCRATHKNKNYLYHQQQVTLRNTATDLNTLWRLLRISVAWRHHNDIRICWESLPLVVWTTAHLTLVILAGLFSSWLLHAGNEVLSRSPWCGTTSDPYYNTVYSVDPSALSAKNEYNNYKNSRFATVQQHIDICESSHEECSVLSTDQLVPSWAVKPNECPFSGSICRPGTESISFDTGFLSSALHLGFNAGKRDRISFRMVGECAPLDDAKYVTPWQDIPQTSALPAHEAIDVQYGPGESPVRNSTFSWAKQQMECDQGAIVAPYVLNAEYSVPGGSVADRTTTFDPIPELQLNDRDVSLIMLMVNRLYADPVDDPWFAAHTKVNDTETFCLGDNATAYAREIPVTTLGCTQQWQICDTDSFSRINSSRCTPLQAISQLWDVFNSDNGLAANYNPRQRATIDRFLWAAKTSSFYYVVRALSRVSGAPLKARRLADGFLSPSLPNTQWQIESKYWLEILLGSLQQSSMDYSTGQFVAKTDFINSTTPASDSTGSAYWLCQNQIINSTTYRNFNFFALLLCVVLCTIITILGLTIEDIIGYVRQRKQKYTGHNGKQDMWIVNSDLEMLRTVSQLKNNTKWTRSPLGIPLAAVGAEADIEDLRSDDLDVAPGHGIYNRDVRRTQTMTTMALSPQKRRALGHDFHGGHKRCGTCHSLELLSATSDDSLARNTSTGNVKNEKYQDFTFSNEIPSHSTQYHVPLLPTDVSSTAAKTNSLSNTNMKLKSQPRRNQNYEMVQLDGAAVTGSNNILPTFHFNHSIPSRDTVSPELPNEDHVNKRGGMFLGGDAEEYMSSGDATDSEIEPRRNKKGGVWLWKRRKDDQGGPIC